MLELNIPINMKYSISDAFMFEISDYKAKSQNYKTPFNSAAFQKKILPQFKKQI